MTRAVAILALVPLAACTAHQEVAARNAVAIALAPSILLLAARTFAALRPDPHATKGDASRPRRRSFGWRGA